MLFRSRRYAGTAIDQKTANLVFQALPHTLGLANDIWRILAKAHEVRNVAEYEGHFDADATILRNLIEAAEAVRVAVTALAPLPGN